MLFLKFFSFLSIILAFAIAMPTQEKAGSTHLKPRLAGYDRQFNVPNRRAPVAAAKPDTKFIKSSTKSARSSLNDPEVMAEKVRGIRERRGFGAANTVFPRAMNTVFPRAPNTVFPRAAQATVI